MVNFFSISLPYKTLTLSLCTCSVTIHASLDLLRTVFILRLLRVVPVWMLLFIVFGPSGHFLLVNGLVYRRFNLLYNLDCNRIVALLIQFTQCETGNILIIAYF